MINYKIGTNYIDWTQLCDLYGEVGLVGVLGERKDCDGIKSTFLNSSKVVAAWDGHPSCWNTWFYLSDCHQKNFSNFLAVNKHNTSVCQEKPKP